MNLYLIRHSHTKLNSAVNKQGKLKGWLNIPLDQKGHTMARETGTKLKGKGIQMVYGADLKRSADTAKIIAKTLGVPVQTSKAFRPQNWGNLTGRIKGEAEPTIKEHIKNPDKPLPGGESFNQYRGRFLNGLTSIAKKGQDAVVVAHDHSDNLVKEWLKNGMDNTFKPNADALMKETSHAPANVQKFTI